MKKYLIKLSILATVALVLLMSCSKNDDAKVDEPISAYVLVTDELTPGDIVEIKSDKTLTFSNVDIVLIPQSKPTRLVTFRLFLLCRLFLLESIVCNYQLLTKI